MPGGPELVFILIIVLLLFGAKKLPELARGLGQSLGEFKKAKDEFEREIHKTTAELETKEAAGKEIAATEPVAAPVAAPAAQEPPKTV